MMMFMPLLLVAAAAATPAATVDTSRAAYLKCLRTDLKKSLEDKMPVAEYEIAVKAACPDLQAAFRAAVVAYNRSSGDSAADAAENADMQVEDYVANFTEKFTDFSESGTSPGKDY